MSMFTTTMRYTGSSGIDVESMVTSIMKAESLKYDRLSQQKTSLQWKQQAYQGISTSMKEFQATYLNIMNPATNMRLSSVYSGFTVSSKLNGSATGVVTATTTSETQAGTYKMDVTQLAQAQTYMSTGKVTSEVKSTIDMSKLDFSNMQAGDTFKIALDNGGAKTITFTAEDVTALKSKAKTADVVLNEKFVAAFGMEGADQKVTASVSNGKLVIKPLVNHTISLANGNMRKQEALGSAVPNFNVPGTQSFTVELGGVKHTMNVQVTGSDTASTIAEKMNKALSNYGLGSSATVSVVNQEGSDKGKMKITATNTSETIKFSGNLVRDAMGATEVTIKPTNPLGDFGIKTNDTSKLDLKKSMADIFPGFDPTTSNGKFVVNGKTITFNPKGSVADFMNTVNKADAGVKMKYDTMYESFVLESSSTGVENAFKLDASGEALFVKLGMAQTHEAQDAQFSINGGGIISRSTNNFDMYGLKIQLNDVTEAGKPVIITTEQDASATKDLIKTFVEAYNKMVDGMQSEYSTSKTKQTKYTTYQPLTNEERANMTEGQIKTWEDEAKKGLLFRDPIVNNILSSMRSMLYEAVELPNGGKISLYEIGITTSSNYRDGGKLVIDDAKLTKALTERTEDVAKLFTKSSQYEYIDKANGALRMKEQGLAERLNDIITSTVSANGAIGKKAGFGSLDTGSDIAKQLMAVDTQMSEMYKALIKKEENYYAKFAAMEKAVTASNSQMSWLQSMLGA